MPGPLSFAVTRSVSELIAAAEVVVDPVTREVIAGRLLATVDEMAIVLARASISPVIYEVLDFACGVCDRSGDLVAQTDGITALHHWSLCGRDGARRYLSHLTGIVDPHRFAGGRIKLDPQLSAESFAPIAAALRLSVVAAAQAVIGLAEANMINALKLVTIQRGHDPRDLTMVVSGGGGPMHAAKLGRELEVKRVVIPRYAGLFSAWGMLTARPRIDLHRTRLLPLDAKSFVAVQEIFGELEAEAVQRFDVSKTEVLFDHAIEMRYVGQEHTVSTRLDPRAGLDAALAAFHAAHEKTYTFRLDDTGVEQVTFHLSAEIDTPRIGMPEISTIGSVEEAIVGRRELHVGDRQAALATVYDRDQLPAGASFSGPALIEEATATTAVLPGQRITIDRFGLLLIEEGE